MKTNNRSWLWFLGVVFVLAALYTGVRYILDWTTYQKGHAALLSADCTTALSAYDSILNAFHLVKVGSYQAQAALERDECLPFQNAAQMQNSGSPAGALIAFDDFINHQPNSVLVQPARTRMAQMLLGDPAGLAQANICGQLPKLTASAALDVPTRAKVMPGLYHACAAAYLTGKDEPSAYQMYHTLLAEYPQHALAAAAEAAILKMPYTCQLASQVKNDQVFTARADLVPGIYNTCAGYYTQNNDPKSAYGLYLALLNEYPNHPLAAGALASLQKNPAVCDTAAGVGLPDVLKKNQETAAALYIRCGDTYAAAKEYNNATSLYQRFLDEYPQDTRVEEVRTKLAQALIAAARGEGAGEIGAPNKVGAGTGASTIVEIQNDSPNTIRLVFTGPVTRIEKLEPCTSCIIYSMLSPTFCPAKGPKGRYELPSGTYDVLVESIGEKVTPFTGTWALDESEYYSCFFIVRTTQ